MKGTCSPGSHHSAPLEAPYRNSSWMGVPFATLSELSLLQRSRVSEGVNVGCHA